MSPAPPDSLQVVPAADLPSTHSSIPWLVQGLWACAGVGLIGGAPKCCKSWLGLDLALSVASGTPCLGRFPVLSAGSVLVHLAEDAPAVLKARLLSLCYHRRLHLDRLPIQVITSCSLRLDLDRDQHRLACALDLFRPRLLLLDPFVRLHRIDENSAQDVSALLGYLRDLQRRYDVAIAVVHHTRKSGAQGPQAGLALRGSSDFHAWGDSNLYLRRLRDHLILSIEHRAAPAPDPLALVLRPLDDPGGGAYLDLLLDSPADAVRHAPAHGDLDDTVLAALSAAPHPHTRGALRTALRVRNERLGHALDRLLAQGRLVRHGDLWALPSAAVPVPAPL